MVNTTEKPENKKYHFQQQAIVNKLKNPGMFAGLSNGFFKYDIAGNLALLADGCFVSVTTGVKAAYFYPDIDDDTTLSADILNLVYTLVYMDAGAGLYVPGGFTWLVFDTDKYCEISKDCGFEEDEFRIYPQGK